MLLFVVLYSSVLCYKFVVIFFIDVYQQLFSDGRNRLTRVRVWQAIIQSLMENTVLTVSQNKNVARLPPITTPVQVVSRNWPRDLFIVRVMMNRYEGLVTLLCGTKRRYENEFRTRLITWHIYCRYEDDVIPVQK